MGIGPASKNYSAYKRLPPLGQMYQSLFCGQPRNIPESFINYTLTLAIMYKVAVILALVASTYAQVLTYSGVPTLGRAPLAAYAQQVAAPIAVAAPVARAVVAEAEPFDPHPQYSYGYSVADGLTGDSKTATETRDGGVVKGQYSLVEPDGAVRTVTYTADDVNGFNAVVDRQPGAVQVAAPVVRAAAPVAVAPAPVAVAAPAPVLRQVAAAPLIRQVAAGPTLVRAAPAAVVSTSYSSPSVAFAY
ncbi:unnamed protein product [Allacma fusca]|uniref:Cuticle protein n=1 Tax=Allacma fusca TaxID=39272 RepID=A0A8J2KL23_9HEXA|nr:unnamed protein product [Allacma fusca]